MTVLILLYLCRRPQSDTRFPGPSVSPGEATRKSISVGQGGPTHAAAVRLQAAVSPATQCPEDSSW